ncbi:DUF4382 domain-containing protein [uncultured Draconibacterium sp.]|uniref:DUF4382 domain-containing protein n=1 Tax=uncultured Draconibacterium sp. TaxID=1573823 RepID=UPI0025F195DA|nr:DUF4382 domain-containing protein [uncultured Draconibacterium sp.]
MNRKRTWFTTLIIAAFAVVIVVFSACQEEYVHEEIGPDPTDPVVKSGELVIRLTDAPFPTDLVAEANVSISKIEIHEIDDQLENAFITVSEEEQSFNLLDLTNGVSAILADTAIEAGTYNEIRLYIDSASVMLTDSTVFDLKIPSGSQSGIKVKINPAIDIDSTSTEEILLDFDVSKSFVVQGNTKTPAGIKGFLFKPVIKATTPSTTGILKGTVTDEEDSPIEGAQVSVYAADTLYTTSFTEENGDYKIIGIEAGIFDVEFEKEGYNTSREEGVEITVENTTKLNAVLTAEEE